LENKEKDYKKMEETAIARQADLQSQSAALAQQQQNSPTSDQSTPKSANAQLKEALISHLDANTESFLTTVQNKREQNQQQLAEAKIELQKQQAKKKTKKTQLMDEQIEQSLERKIANLESKEKEYKKLEEEAIELKQTLQGQTETFAQQQQHQQQEQQWQQQEQQQQQQRQQRLSSVAQDQSKQTNQTNQTSTSKNNTQTANSQSGTSTSSSNAQTAAYQSGTSTSSSNAQTAARQSGTGTSSSNAQTAARQSGTSTSSSDAQTAARQSGTSTPSSYTQTTARQSGTSTPSSDKTLAQNTRISYGYQTGNVSAGYYIVFGSFIERSNAVRFLDKLRLRFPNVVDIGNDNMFDMYRTGIGPYTTKEEAVAQRPTDMKNWILRVEPVTNTRLVAYIEIFD
jgi:hypothetical protein